MQYHVIPTADGTPLDQLAAATGKFRLILESKLGSIARVRECFLASAKQTREGQESLFPTEVIDADAYRSAFNEAEGAAKQVLNRQDVGFMVRFEDPAAG